MYNRQPQRRVCANFLRVRVLEQHTARRENAVSNVIVHTQLHRQCLFLPDDLRHLYKQQPKPLIRLCQLRVFRFQLVLLPDQLCNVCGSDLRIADARLCCDLLLRKACLLYTSRCV